MSDKHLLFWVFKALAYFDLSDPETPLDMITKDWLLEKIQAPDWVLPALMEKIKEFEAGGHRG